MTKGHLTWPPTTMNGRPRTITGIRRIVQSIEQNENVTKEYLKGIKGRSVLLDQENFDVIHDLPAEYMHLVCLGTVKRVVNLTYNVGKKRHVKTKHKRCDPKLFNDLIVLVKVPRENSRRCRNLDPSVYKAQEYRNLLLIFFPLVLKNLPANYVKERKLWLCLVFMIRSCVLPNEEFDLVCKETIVNSCELFYNLFFELYGQRNCSYSIHIVSSHLLKMRGNVPLTERSAFPFESFYSEMKNLFKPGTSSPLKQIICNTYMKRALEHHVCTKSILYKEKSETETLENNSMIYTFQNNTFQMYVIVGIENETITCKRQGKFQFTSQLMPNHDWSSIGVYRQGPIGEDLYSIEKNDIKGKVVNVLDMLITCPLNVLNEK